MPNLVAHCAFARCFTLGRAQRFDTLQAAVNPHPLAGAALGGLEAALPPAAHSAETLPQIVAALPPPAPLFDVSAETPIWENIVRYGQYFFSVMLGTGYVMLKPFAQLLKQPVTAVLLIGSVVGLFYFVKTTVNAMLGVDDLFQYEASSAVTNAAFTPQ